MIKWLHIVSSTVLLGTGAGIAFFFLRAQRTGDTKIIAAVDRDVVLADMVFTATAVVLQPVTGIVLAFMAGFGNRGRGQRVTAAGGISAMSPLVVYAGVASIYRGAGDFLFDGGEADVGITSEGRPRSHRDQSLGQV